MKRIMNLTAAAALMFSLTLLFVTTSGDAYAQQKGKTTEKGFVDKNGDGLNDNAKDADGDGIPNGQDPDYQRLNPEKGFVDADGDGINDNAKDADGDGIPNGQDPDYVSPKDGSGSKMGAGNKGGQGTGSGTKASEMQNRVKGFVDENGDGVNDNARDNDGDGIPNGQDPDYQRQNPMNGKGKMGFIDENGDGINDLALDADGDGIPNGQDPDYVRPQDGTGRKFGQGRGIGTGTGTGDCDGMGPKGKTNKRGGRN